MSKCRRRTRRHATVSACKPDLNAVTARVRRTGPEKFGIIAVDCSKRTYAVRIGNFYGDLALRRDFPKTAGGMEQLTGAVTAAARGEGYEDMVAAVEMTGTYHLAAKLALAAICEVKLVHPFTTKQLRQPASPGIKTDDVDLEALTRAVIAGYGGACENLPEVFINWRETARGREDLVRKATTFKAQCKEKLESVMPGYSDIFSDDMWDRTGPWDLVRLFPSPRRILRAGVEGLRRGLRSRRAVMRRPTLERVVAWAADACEPLPGAEFRHRLLVDGLDLHAALTERIAAYECLLFDFLVDSPAVLLVGMPGVNVVSAAGYGAELGPPVNYPRAGNILGRAGLFPSRHQSDATDRSNGPVVRGHNARLRHAILSVARNLIHCNPYYRGFAQLRQARNWSPEKIEFAVANRFVRISFQMLGGPSFFRHPNGLRRDAVLPKLIWFGHEHNLDEGTVGDRLVRAVASFPDDGLLYEIQALEGGPGVTGPAYPKALAGAAERARRLMWERVGTGQQGGTITEKS